MPAEKLTAKSVDRWPSTSARQEIPDALVPGLYLVVQPSGTKSWALRYRRDGRNHKATLGRYPAMSLASARDAARGYMAAQPAAVAPSGGCTVADAAEQYITSRLATLRTGRAQERTLRHAVLPAIGEMKLRDLKRRDLMALIDATAQRAPMMANRLHALLHSLLRWCVDRDLIDANPMAGVQRPTRERERDRVLTDAELKALWRAFGLYGWPFGAACKLMLMTAQRRGEVGSMRWCDLNLDAGVWRLSAEQTKNAKSHDVPLVPIVVQFIRNLPRLEGDFVFRSMRGNFAASSWSQAKVRFDALSGVSDWRIHDLRRTAATGLARLGTRPDVISMILNHTKSAGITAIYNRYSYEPEMRAALTLWSETLIEIGT